MDKMRFGLIGAGMAGPYFGESLGDLPDTELVAVATTREESARPFAEKYGVPDWYTDWRKIVERDDIDAVAVISPPYLHEEMVVAAAEAGKHVIAEKPIAANLEQADRMIAACDRAGVTFGVIFMYRFMDNIRQIKQAVDDGRLGKLVLGDCHTKFFRTQEYYDSAPWRGTFWGEGGGILAASTIHTIDNQIWIMGEVDSLAAFHTTATHEMEAEDTVVASLRFKNGALGSIVASSSTRPGYPRRLEIHGEKGSILLKGDDIVAWDVEGMSADEYLSKPKKDLGDSFSRPGYADSTNHRLQLRDFVDAIKEGRSPLVDGREGRRALEVIAAIHQSSRTGKVVKFPVQNQG
jgi:UDP-N-acetyl-2-amino-2-deoxyglucuronate dehydrogenase